MLNIALSVLGNRFGQIAIAFVVAWLWSYHETSVHYEKLIAAEKAAANAAYKAELARQAQAAKDIAQEAAARSEADAKAASEMQKMIDDYASKLGEKPNEITKIVNSPCVVDSEFSNVVRKLDSLGRKAKPTRSSVKFR
jgi:hypothetical protein